jgi:hypothetical protein
VENSGLYCCSRRQTDRGWLGRATDRVEASRQKPAFGRANPAILIATLVGMALQARSNPADTKDHT